MARELDSIKGRLLHYSAAVRHLGVLVTDHSCSASWARVQKEEYDGVGPAPVGLVAVA